MARRYVVSGGGWIAGSAHGLLSESRAVPVSNEAPEVPARNLLYERPPARFGRFDEYTRLGCAAAALALKDAGLERAGRRLTIGAVVSSRRDCLDTDLAYHRTTCDRDGLFASPQLFSYTLPNVVLGECAVQFGLTGPTFSVGDSASRGGRALCMALGLLDAGLAEVMLAGWIESAAGSGPDAARGALFVVVEAAPREGAPVVARVHRRGETVHLESGAEITSLARLGGTGE